MRKRFTSVDYLRLKNGFARRAPGQPVWPSFERHRRIAVMGRLQWYSLARFHSRMKSLSDGCRNNLGLVAAASHDVVAIFRSGEVGLYAWLSISGVAQRAGFVQPRDV